MWYLASTLGSFVVYFSKWQWISNSLTASTADYDRFYRIQTTDERLKVHHGLVQSAE